MKKPTLTICFLFIGIFNLFSIENYFAGARSLALSNAFISFSDSWSTFHNQAGIANLNDISGGIFFESKFMIDELSLAAGSFIIPAKSGTFGISFFQFGKGTFKEIKTGLAFAKQLTEKWSAGIQLDYFSQTFPENKRPKGFATFEGGIIYNPDKDLFLGAHIFNPVFGGIETLTGKQKVPAILRIGGHYIFSKITLLSLEIQKDSENPLLIKTGVEFAPIENLAVRFGVSGKPVNITSGIGYKIKKLTTDIGFSYHGNLGVTPSVSIQFTL